MYNRRTSASRTYRKSTRNTKSSHSKRSGRFRGKSKSQKINISSFINKTITSSTPEEIFAPEHSFADFELSPILLRSIGQKGYKKPTLIQDKIIPFILLGKDVVGLANTGTGKTAAFLFPLIEKALQNADEQILIVTPTRELAPQIDYKEYAHILCNLCRRRIYKDTNSKVATKE